MFKNLASCIKNVDSEKRCQNCSTVLIKYGFTKTNKQRYKCTNCKKTYLENYCYRACNAEINDNIVVLIKEGLSIRGISRVLEISTTTLLKRIIKISNVINPPNILNESTFEVDEICTYIKLKTNRVWIVYALDTINKKVVAFNVGSRTNATLRKVVNKLLTSNAKVIRTDKLINYKSLIPSNIHKTTKYGTNHIERLNLTLRTHLKRLNRKSICFSKSVCYLVAVLKIYFWL